MTKKSKCYEDGGEIEFETKTGKNEAIGDDTRARAMKFLEKSAEEKQEVKPKSRAASRKVVAKAKTSLPMPDYSNEDLDRMGMNEDLKPAKRFDPAAAAGVRKPAAAPSFMMKSMGYKSGGGVKSASARADGCAIRGKTKA